MYISPVKSHNYLRFTSNQSVTGSTSNTSTLPYRITQPYLTHNTGFFRDIDDLVFLKEYLNKNFPQGTHIADFACSEGKETFSIAMMLDNINKNHKYKISGFDMKDCFNIIDYAKKGEYQIDSSNEGGEETFLVAPDYKLSPNQNKFKKLFLTYFEKIEAKSDVYSTTEKYRVKKDSFKKVVDFYDGDIRNLDQYLLNTDINDKGQTGVILFKNAFYHLKNDELEGVVKRIHDCLPVNGLLVMGKLMDDHIIESDDLLNCNDEVQIEGKSIRVKVDSPMHNLLKRNKFEPIFFRNHPDYPNGAALPTIWKKIA